MNTFQKLLPIAAGILLVFSIPSARAEADPNDPTEILRSLTASRQEWPPKVMLKKEQEFQATLNGAVIGHFSVQPGVPVALVAVHGAKVIVASQNATKELDAADTDLVERVQSNGNHPAPASVPPAATPAPPSPAPAVTASSLSESPTSKPPAPHIAHSPEVQALIDEAEALKPTQRQPIKLAKDEDEKRTHLTEIAKKYMALPVEEVTAHPAAADFPGAVPDDAPRIKRTLTFPANLPRWESTGLYAAPGEKITVQVSAEEVAKGLSVVIGSQRDTIFKSDKWPRFPIISRTFKLTQPVTTIGSAFGGLIYVDVPREKQLGGYQVPTYGGYGWLDENPHAVAGSFQVTIEGGVDSPLFQLGKTTPEAWLQKREAKAPWGELASDKIILTVPTPMLQTLANPAPLLEFWGKVVDAEAQLAGWPKQPTPPERLVPDREISAGWMHSGYPVMFHIVSAADMIDLEKLKKEGDWGFFHELGHNHEPQASTFGGDYVEVDVNFFSMYVMEKVVGRKMTAHSALADIDKLVREKVGPDHTSDAWHNLAMYILPIQALGWDSFQKTLASYATPDGAKNIKTREDKMDQWVFRYSKATGKNLAPYFAAFDVTCSDKTRDALKSLPLWLPNPGFPQSYGAPAPSTGAEHPTASQ